MLRNVSWMWLLLGTIAGLLFGARLKSWLPISVPSV